MLSSSAEAVFHRPSEEVAVKEKEIFEYLEREVLKKERCVTYQEVAEKVDYYFVEVIRLVTKFYEANKSHEGLTATFSVCGVQWSETEAEFEERKSSNPETTRRFTVRNILANAEELEEFRGEVDEIRQLTVYSLQFEKCAETVEDMLKLDQKLMNETEDIEKWFKRCWWRRGSPEQCREKMLNSGEIDMYPRVTKDAKKYQVPLSKGPLPNPNKPIKKPKVEEKADKKISALFNKAMEKKKIEEPDKNKHTKHESPMKAVSAAEKEKILQTSPLFKTKAKRIRIDSDSDEEAEPVKAKEKTPPAKKKKGKTSPAKGKKEMTPPAKSRKSHDFDMSQDLFSTGSTPSPAKMDVDEEPEEEEEEKPKTKKGKAKPTAKRNIFKQDEPTEKEIAPSTSKEAEDNAPKTVKCKERGHETYLDDEGFLVTSQKNVTVEKEASTNPPKAPLKRSNAAEASPSAQAPPPKKKAPTGQSKISSFFSAPKK